MSTTVLARRARTRSSCFTEPYSRLVGELESRGWLPTDVAAHARARLARDTPGS